MAKSTNPAPLKSGRKHGGLTALPSRQAAGGSAMPIGGSRIQTSLTFAASRQAYLWFTDRSRSRLLVKF
ncbi:MAG: hypothetical protein WC943_10380 [Elusimicrobiota bacterium]|jgi:hypothetical protein